MPPGPSRATSSSSGPAVVEDPNTYVLVEGFTDDGAGPHVNSDHFKKAMEDLPQALSRTPQIISKQVEGEGWGPMGELQID